MKQQGATWLLIILAGVLLLAVVLYHAAKPAGRDPAMKPVLPEGVQAALEGESRITASEKGRMAWTMTSSSLDFYRGRGVVEVQEPMAWIPLKEGGTVEVKGTAGRYFQETEDMVLEDDVVVLHDRTGKREWIMHGNTASYRHHEKAFYISGIHGTIHSGRGESSRPNGRSYNDVGESAEIRGGKGRYDIANRTMRLSEDVVCKWSKGITVETESLDYSLEKEMASTEARVLIRGQGFRLRGQGLRADMEGEDVVIPGAVSLRLDRGMGGVK